MPDGVEIAPAITSEALREEDKQMWTEKDGLGAVQVLGAELPGDEDAAKNVVTRLEIGATRDEVADLEVHLAAMTMERTQRIIKELIFMHEDDPNFSSNLLDAMRTFVDNEDVIQHPDKHEQLVSEMKLEAILATENSPYAEVRANVDPTDDPTMPASTIRAWFIGVTFSCIGSFIDNLFAFRNPSISVGTNVAQLCAYPLGKFMARTIPDWRFTLFGNEISFNPGPFNRKEHMVISIMANVSFVAPYTFYIIPGQALPQYFDMPFAYQRGYQWLISIAVNGFGYGLAGLLRRFLVFPSIAIWPTTFSTVALIKAFHSQTNEPVPGPFGRIYKASREKIFLMGSAGMFCYYFFPGFIFQALSIFSWMTWIAPNNAALDAITGTYGGVALNPWPTFDWNLFGGQGLYLPTFTVVNQVIGLVIGAVISIAVWYTNVWNTGYLPINANGTYDNTGAPYNITSVLDDGDILDEVKYQNYSQPYFSAAYIIYNLFALALYTAAFSYVWIFHGREVWRGFKGVYRSVFKKTDDEDLSEDVHYRLMKQYKEVPDWHYLILLIVPILFGCAAVAGYPTNAPVAALFYGLVIPLIFIIPIGIIQAVTGIPVPLNMLGNIIGGAISEGNANALIYFEVWAYLSSWQALSFCNDLKLAHYLKIPPRVTFWAQVVATLIYATVSGMSYNFIMSLPNTSFYTATIFWGVLGPKKLFGKGQRYNMMLLGFPIGLAAVLIYWGLRRKFPRSKLLRQIHPVMIISGPVSYYPPFNLAYNLGNLYVNLLSFHYIRKKYLAFWAKWNYVISAAFSCGIALCGLFCFFVLDLPHGGFHIDWWGNNVVGQGCEGAGGCPRLTVPEGSFFGPAPGTYT